MSKEFPYPSRPLDWAASPHDYTGDNILGYRVNDATQRYVLGTRGITWDGKVHRYYRTGTATTSYQRALFFNDTGDITYEAPAAAAAAGATELLIAEASITEDQFAGGYIILFHATGNGAVYSIKSNDATSGSNFRCYLAEPLARAVTTSDALEMYISPYADLRSGTTTTKAWGGLPAQGNMTSGYYGWLQTWGPCFISPQSTVGEDYAQSGYFRNDGSIDARGNVGTNVSDQRAGTVLIGGAAGNGPLFMLQVNI
jgi:hypothetical protein